ncbi:MAG: 30S ribosomal protein S3ae [Thermoplasmata archaeon]|nr:30S ribosomal protein S3ae [Candidatus Sysuiplasma acidicola]MBX8646829.1 30S ribosomal protein S3ae [Candidatus Sysuiplasma acidicola]
MADKSKSASRKVKDKWKEKSWFKIYAPEMFNSIELGETPATSQEDLNQRTTEATVQDLTGDFSKMHIKLRFKADSIKGNEVHTQFIGHDLTNDYVRRLTRRKRTKTEHVVDAVTKDGFTVRLKPMVVTERRIQSAQETSIRNITTSLVKSRVSGMMLGELVKAIVAGDLAKEIAASTKIIIPMKKVEIRRSEIIALPPEGFVIPPSPAAAEQPPSEEPVKPAEQDAEELPSSQEVPAPAPSPRAEEEISPEEIIDNSPKRE